MDDNISLDTRLIDMTARDLIDIINEAVGGKSVRPATVIADHQPKRELVWGIAGISRILGCSKSTVCKLKRNGVLDKAVTQVGRKIIADVNLLMEIKQPN